MSCREFPVLDFLRRREISFHHYLCTPRTVLLSVQYISFTSLHSSSLHKTHPILEVTTVAVSSSLGMVSWYGFQWGYPRFAHYKRAVDTIIAIYQAKIRTLSISILTGVGKMMEFHCSNFSEFVWFMASWHFQLH